MNSAQKWNGQSMGCCPKAGSTSFERRPSAASQRQLVAWLRLLLASDLASGWAGRSEEAGSSTFRSRAPTRSSSST